MNFSLPRTLHDDAIYRLMRPIQMGGNITWKRDIKKAVTHGAELDPSGEWLHVINLPVYTKIAFPEIHYVGEYNSASKVKIIECPNKHLQGIQFYTSIEEIEKLDVEPCK